MLCFQPSWSSGPRTCCWDTDWVASRFSTPSTSNQLLCRWQCLIGIQRRCIFTTGIWKIGENNFLTIFCSFSLRSDIDTTCTAKQVAMVWACVTKRRHWLGEEMYGIWGGGLQTKRSTKEYMERGCAKKIAKHVIWTGRMLRIVVDGRS